MGNNLFKRGRRRRTPSALLILSIGSVGLVVFMLGFVLFWGVGVRVAGGNAPVLGIPSLSRPSSVSDGNGSDGSSFREYPVSVPVDLLTFRDLSYVPVKGIYVSSWVAGSPEHLESQLEMADRTEINAMVVDIKDATGYVTYDTGVEMAGSLDLEELRIKDIDGLVARLREREIVPIARIVCFKDPILARRKPEWAVRDVDGGLWTDNKGFPYIDPYRKEAWAYLVDVAEDAVDHGFREIQFDYVRFPSDGKISDTVYPGKNSDPEDAIAAFLQYARERLELRGAWVSADVFGLTVHVYDDLGIGQKVEKVSRNVDIVSPMIYPSHYSSGTYGIQDPNSKPYETITGAMQDAATRLEGTGATVRPWLQDFSLGGVEYGVDEVEAQIRAVEDQGYEEWLLWDPSMRYTEGALRPRS